MSNRRAIRDRRLPSNLRGVYQLPPDTSDQLDAYDRGEYTTLDGLDAEEIGWVTYVYDRVGTRPYRHTLGPDGLVTVVVAE